MIRVLNTLLSLELDATKKKEILTNQFDMKMTKEMEGRMRSVSNLGEYLVYKTEKRVEKEVTERVTQQVTQQVTQAKLIQSIENVIESLGVSLERACEVLKTTVEEYEQAKAFLAEK